MKILRTKKVKLKGNQYKINTSGWQCGMYFVRVKFKEEILTGNYSNWEDESDGVALILLSDGTEWRTGGLINNTERYPLLHLAKPGEHLPVSNILVSL